MNVAIDIDSRELEAAFRKSPGLITAKVNAWIYKTTLRVERSAKQHVPPNVDTGTMQSSIHSSFGRLSATVRPTAKYAKFVHDGRRPGKMPPFAEGTGLHRWATKRGMNPFLVARAIGRRGTKPNKYMDKAFKEVKPKAEQDARAMLGDIVRSI